TDRTRENEQTATQRRRKGQFRIDDSSCAIDVHRDFPTLAPLHQIFDSASDLGKASGYDLVLSCSIAKFKNPRRSRIDRMKAVAEPGYDLAVRRNEGVEAL